MIIKNTYGYSIIPSPKFMNPDFLDTCRGSSLDRQNKVKEQAENNLISDLDAADPDIEILKQQINDQPKPVKEKKEKKLWSMSGRTKSKIKKKLFSFFGLYKRLSFLTLTFVNKVEDEIALKLLGKFLDNAKKQDKDFEYLWVAERQEKNEIFKDNIHFHLISNKYWKIDKYWNYWLKIQEKCGIVPRQEGYKPSSAFDVKQIRTNDPRRVGTYLTKYVTKNSSQFRFFPWNCSKRISRLYTDFYTGWEYLKELQRLDENGLTKVKTVPLEYCNVVLHEINKMTLPFYQRLHTKNREMWNNKNI